MENTNKKVLHIFDLDETVISSSHRTPYFPNGDLNLNLYREKQTHENIMKDKLLPLAEVMKEFIDDGCEVAIITARRMTKSDYVMLRKNAIKTAYIGSRDRIHKVEHISNCLKKHFFSTDSEYKRVWFKDIKEKFPLSEYEIYMYDDNKSVLKVALEEGFHAIDSIQLNKIITGAV